MGLLMRGSVLASPQPAGWGPRAWQGGCSHPRACLLVTAAPGEAPIFPSLSPHSTETVTSLPQAQRAQPAGALGLPEASAKFPSCLLRVILFNSYAGLKTKLPLLGKFTRDRKSERHLIRHSSRVHCLRTTEQI